MAQGFVLVAVLCAALLGSPSAASAQDRTVGLVMAYPTQLGVLWQASKRLALRPEVSASWSWSDWSEAADNGRLSTQTAEKSDSHLYGFGVSALVTVGQWERVSVYVVPRVSYSRAVTTAETNYPVTVQRLDAPAVYELITVESKSTTSNYSASFGSQYRPADRFALFGEGGFGYSRTTTAPSSVSSSSVSSQFPIGPLASSRPRQQTLGLRAGIGLIFFF